MAPIVIEQSEEAECHDLQTKPEDECEAEAGAGGERATGHNETKVTVLPGGQSAYATSRYTIKVTMGMAGVFGALAGAKIV